MCAFLRRLHPQRTAENVAADVYAWKVSAFTIRNMLDRQTAPGAILWCALIDVYGAPFLAAAHPKRLAWLDEAAQAHERAAIRAEMAVLAEKLERL